MVAAVLVFAMAMSGFINLAEKAMGEEPRDPQEELTAPLLKVTADQEEAWK